MKIRRLLSRSFIIMVSLAALLPLVACGGKGQPEEPGFPSSQFISSTDLFSLYIPEGWSLEEVIPGANLIMTNTEAALKRYQDGGETESGDFVINVGFLPLTLLQEPDLAHLGFQLEASPEVLLQSLLPLFLIGDVPARHVAGEVTLVSLSDGQEAGLLTFSEEKREGLVLVFEAGKNVFAFVSAAGFPGEMNRFEETIYALAAEVAYNGKQDALNRVLYGE